MRQNVKSEVRHLLGLILHRTIGEDENPRRETEAQWDSLQHVEMVFLLEDHFGIKFTEQDLLALTSVDEITRILEQRLAT